MKIENVLLVIFFGILFASCEPELSTKNYMIDSWETTYLKIEMFTAHQSDSLQVYEDNFDNDPELVAQSKYNKDGTFSAWFKNKKGEDISKTNGKWNVINDSLFVAFNYQGKDIKVSYYITKTAEGFLGKSKYDWDEDGDYDDLLIMKTKRIKTD